LRNALIPVVTILVFDIAAIFAGAILTETVFSCWHGPPVFRRFICQRLAGGDGLPVISAVLVVIFT
jgi:ABC-type dipeptide/oligopeptide/nickel transport system permease component